MPSVVLCQMIAEEAGLVCGRQELQSLLVELVQGRGAAINPIEQSELNPSHATSSGHEASIHVRLEVYFRGHH